MGWDGWMQQQKQKQKPKQSRRSQLKQKQKEKERMGSVGVDDAEVEAFLRRCEPSADAAYAELKALLGSLHDPATRRDARLFLAALRRRSNDHSSSGCYFFRRYGFRIHDLLLHGHGLPITFLSGAAASSTAAGTNK